MPSSPRDGAMPAARRWRLPSLCAVCHGWGEGRVCGDCVARFAAPVPRCRRCAIALTATAAPADAPCGACLVDPPPFARSVATVDYGYPWDLLIARLKFRDALDLAPALARLMLAAPGAARLRPALIVPVPLSRERLRERGYNQAWELARRVAGALRVRADARLLLRIRDTPHQLALPPAERAANVHGAFAVEPGRRAEVEGREVGVVDDVMTTGGTAAEVARVLLRAGAASVSVWVCARTPAPADP